MSTATTHCISLQGAHGHLIDVQADLSDGTVGTAMVGRPDLAISESRDRCRAAVVNSGFTWPVTKRVTILLSPADLPKSGPHFDLAIAVSVLAAGGTVDPPELKGTVFLGELTLDGRLRAVPGVLPMVIAASRAGLSGVMLPDCQVEEAALVPGIAILGVRSLQQAVAVLKNEVPPEAPPVPPLPRAPGVSWRGDERVASLDLADVIGMSDARYAIEVAAAGGHHLMLSGPKGAGKTTLAERIPSILPDLTLEQALELSSIHSVAGTLPPGVALISRPPFRAPHHSATAASILGGGSGRTRPGEISQALHGALFLDEFPLFSTMIIEALREPLESGEVTIARGQETATYPARSMFVLAANPCPCGDFHPLKRDHRCTCTSMQRQRYRGRMSGPLTDRIDITRHLEPLGPHEIGDPLSKPEPSAIVRGRVTAARERQLERYAGSPWRLNSDVPGPTLRQHWPVTAEAQTRIDRWLYTGRITHRGATRVHRIAWSLADLRRVDQPDVTEVEIAYLLRQGEPLPLWLLEGREPR
jgi:magnesium chelatase family protein